MGKVIDITGNRYGRLHVLRFHHSEKKRSYWVCECECKKIVILRKDHFAYPYSHQESCGCLHNELASARMKARHEQRRRAHAHNEDSAGGAETVTPGSPAGYILPDTVSQIIKESRGI